MKKRDLARTSIFLGRDQLDQLREISNESGIPVAVMVRRGVARYLDNLPGAPVTGVRPRAVQPELAAKETPSEVTAIGLLI